MLSARAASKPNTDDIRDSPALAARTSTPRVIDGGGTLNVDTWRDAGWTVRVLGRP